MLDSLREQVFEANLELVRRGLVLYTFGNASGIDRGAGLVVIKPSGVPYETLRPSGLVVTDLAGAVVEGGYRPSSDLATHLELYRAFPTVGGVVHTHSRYATAFAQAALEIPCLGTTHADTFHGAVPVTGALAPAEIAGEYERHTGLAIARRFAGLDPVAVPGALVRGHGPFTWGPTAGEAAHNAVILEECALLALLTLNLRPDAPPIGRDLLDKHFFRKHGPGASYGQV